MTLTLVRSQLECGGWPFDCMKQNMHVESQAQVMSNTYMAMATQEEPLDVEREEKASSDMHMAMTTQEDTDPSKNVEQ